MAVSTIAVADSDVADKYLHTWQRTISGTAREDQFIQHGQAVYPTYTVVVQASTAGTAAASHILQVMGDGTNYSRLTRLRVWACAASSATQERFTLLRLSSAGTGGTAATVSAYDSADTYAGEAKHSLIASKGTEGAVLLDWVTLYPTSTAEPSYYEWKAEPGVKPIVFGSATSDGIALKNANAVTGAVVDVHAEFVTTSYL